MITLVATGRLISDALIRDKESNKYLTFTIVVNTYGKDAHLINCIRSIKTEPQNLSSYKKGAVVSVSGEPTINTYIKDGETEINANYNLSVQSLMIISSPDKSHEEVN